MPIRLQSDFLYEKSGCSPTGDYRFYIRNYGGTAFYEYNTFL